MIIDNVFNVQHIQWCSQCMAHFAQSLQQTTPKFQKSLLSILMILYYTKLMASIPCKPMRTKWP